jgi:hypothetical protein
MRAAIDHALATGGADGLVLSQGGGQHKAKCPLDRVVRSHVEVHSNFRRRFPYLR